MTATETLVIWHFPASYKQTGHWLLVNKGLFFPRQKKVPNNSGTSTAHGSQEMLTVSPSAEGLREVTSYMEERLSHMQQFLFKTSF